MFFENLDEKGRILFLGEGNFSFSASVVRKTARNQNLSNIVVSCYEKERSLEGDETRDTFEKIAAQQNRKKLSPDKIIKSEQSNPLKDENIAFLRSVGCEVLHGVDAEALAQDNRLASNKFSQIVFMFPHVGGKMKIHRNRQLVRNVLKSAKHILDENGQVVVTLCKGQGGTPFEKVERLAANTWKVVETAHDVGFVLSQVYYFPHHQFQQYHAVGYRGLQKGFNRQDSVVHVFAVSGPEEVAPINNLDNIKSEILDAEEDPTLPTSLYPPIYTHHCSFWINDELDDTFLDKIIRCSVGKYVLSWKTVDKFISDSGRKSLTIEVDYCDKVRSLGPDRVMFLQRQVLGQSLVRCAGVTLR